MPFIMQRRCIHLIYSRPSHEMKSPLLIIVISSFLLAQSTETSAHFFPNISSIPHSLIPNNTSSPWDAFLKLRDCQIGQKVEGLAKLKQYLQSFGYINSSLFNFTNTFDDYLGSAIKTYQQNFKLNITGQLDMPTLQHIIRPRCGNPDIINGSTTMKSVNQTSGTNSLHIHTVKHYSFFPGAPKWPEDKTELTYAFLPDNQVDNQVQQVFANAFDRWSEVTPLNFTETVLFSDADIRIGFYSGDHNDGEPFDGALGILAHAFSPPSGRFHLDIDENWVLDGNFGDSPSVTRAVDLESVAVHEIGHLLGLGHSSEEDAIMYPTITVSARKVELAADDIQGIQQLYGSNPNFNGSLPTLTPTGGRDTSGSQKLHIFDMYGLIILAGLLILLNTM